jgi:hypothetical protein
MKLMTWRTVAKSILASTGAVAQSTNTARSSCPAGYWQLGSLRAAQQRDGPQDPVCLEEAR